MPITPGRGRGSARSAARVLFVEDDPDVAAMYRLKLELEGCLVDLAMDGEEALELALNVPDLVCLDIRLPRMDGLTVLEHVRQMKGLEATPVLILSNYSESHMVSRALALGAREYLVKSRTTPAALAARCRYWLGTEDPQGRLAPT
ncbi:MAG TPA: response regulator [Candidatus Dormibacteraeota bacterium]|nr:response regulator [Candidatus Dormibacteraeota bacterium]